MSATLRLKEVRGHLAHDRAGGVVAWYAMPAQPWPFRSDQQRLSLIMGAASRQAVLAGRRMHGRVTTRPYPVRKWVEALDRNTPAPLGGKATDSPYDQDLVRVQKHLSDTTLAEKEVYVGVEILTGAGLLDKFFTKPGEAAERLADDVAVVDEVMSGPGMEGRPIEAEEMEWLLRRSVGLGLPMTGSLSPVEITDWDAEDLHTFTDSVEVETPVGGKVSKVTSEQGIERYVAVLSVGRTEAIDVPDRSRDPWMSETDRLPFPVEWSYRVEVKAGVDAAGAVNSRLLIGRDMQKHYAQHGLDTPLDVARKIAAARRVADEMTNGAEVLANRVHGVFRLAVAGKTEKECLARVRQVKDVYRTRRMTVEHPRGQAGLIREFIPGEKISTSAHTRRLPVIYFAAGLPTAASTLGDRRGHYRGYTVGSSRRPVMFDPHFGTEVREKSGLTPIVGGLGSGKSTLMGSIAWDEFADGVPTTLWDPSGPLAALVDLAHDRYGKASARHLNLMRAEPGRLSPYAIIPEPRREHFADDEMWHAATASAAAERKTLALDVCLMLTSQIGEEGRTRRVLTDAIREVGGRRGASLVNVVDALRRHESDPVHGKFVADLLMDAREHPLTALYFGVGQFGEEEHESGLTVITMAGIEKPDLSLPRERWGQDAIMALPLLSLAIYYTSRRTYSGRMRSRKCIGLDEAHFLADWPSGAALLRRLATDSRKWNAAVLAASQNAGHVLSLDVANLFGTGFVGRTEDAQHAREGLRLLRVQEGSGYEDVLANLSPYDVRKQSRSGYREFVMRDVDSKVDKMRVDISHNPDLAQALDTTANPLEVAA